jgi:hypothetical protein
MPGQDVRAAAIAPLEDNAEAHRAPEGLAFLE